MLKPHYTKFIKLKIIIRDINHDVNWQYSQGVAGQQNNQDFFSPATLLQTFCRLSCRLHLWCQVSCQLTSDPFAFSFKKEISLETGTYPSLFSSQERKTEWRTDDTSGVKLCPHIKSSIVKRQKWLQQQ